MWLKVGAVLAVLIIAGVLIWQLAPIDRAIDNVLPKFNNTGNITGGGISGGDGLTDAPTPAPDSFQFQQCADPTSNCCNGLDNGLCDLRVDQVMYATSHNANAAAETGFLVSPNHQFRLEDSLPAGYRGINIDVCNCGGSLTLCHGICNFGARDIVEVMLAINDFLDQNPSEIIIISLELNSEVDQAVDIFEFYDLLLEVPGFVDKFYVHSDPAEAWPTLGSLVDSNQASIIRPTQTATPRSFADVRLLIVRVLAYASHVAESHSFSCAWSRMRLGGILPSRTSLVLRIC